MNVRAALPADDDSPPEAVLARFNDRDEDEYPLDPRVLSRVRRVCIVTKTREVLLARGFHAPGSSAFKGIQSSTPLRAG